MLEEVFIRYSGDIPDDWDLISDKDGPTEVRLPLDDDIVEWKVCDWSYEGGKFNGVFYIKTLFCYLDELPFDFVQCLFIQENPDRYVRRRLCNYVKDEDYQRTIEHPHYYTDAEFWDQQDLVEWMDEIRIWESREKVFSCSPVWERFHWDENSERRFREAEEEEKRLREEEENAEE